MKVDLMDKYASFAELKKNETAGVDYTILYREVDSKLTVMAPHGGGIEPGTIDIADVLAGCEYTFYAFKGLKKTGNAILHINSSAFDEALGLKASQKAFITVSVHGSKDKAEMVHIGGKNRMLKQKIERTLKDAGFNAVMTDIPGLQGIDPDNICNRCKSGKGVQLEISRGLRQKLFDNLDHRTLRKKTVLFYQFVNALKEALPI